MTTVTLDLPQELYRRALDVAKGSRRSVEQVVVEWIQPPSDDEQGALHHLLADLDAMSDAELIQVAQLSVIHEMTERLQDLFALQQQRALTAREHQEIERLVHQEDQQTLRKAKALYLLKQHNALPITLVPQLDL